MKIRLLGTAVAAASLAMVAPAAAQLSTAISTSQQTASETAQSQARINQLDDETAQLLQDYKAALKQLEQLERYNSTLRTQIASQEAEVEELTVQIAAISGLQRTVAPLMEDMVASLAAFVEADAPFLVSDRANRVARAQAALTNPERSPAQRYRQIIEAFQIENEFGRTIEAYESEIDGKLVDVLRIGRVALVYKTKDDSELKIYDRTSGGWIDLPQSYLADVKVGMRMANEQIPPNLLPIPVITPSAQ